MPELPEVETIKSELEKTIIGNEIKKADVKLSKIVNLPVKNFEGIISGKKIKGIKRRAKLLIVKLSQEWNLIIHLKLTGRLIYNQKPEKHTHLIFYFTDNKNLLFNDLRQFGWIKLLKDDEAEKFVSKENFGPEPLEKDFTLETFKNLLAKKKKQKIKPLLIDQTFIAGLGNIYSQEACFDAGILPKRIVNALKEDEIERLFNGIKKILTEAIKYKGSSVDTYRDIFGKEGRYIPFLKVYGRKGQKCFRCGAEIEEIKLEGRGTSYCPKCQK